jgi:hypothetical protein
MCHSGDKHSVSLSCLWILTVNYHSFNDSSSRLIFDDSLSLLNRHKG